jgi:hypothetical protein
MKELTADQQRDHWQARRKAAEETILPDDGSLVKWERDTKIKAEVFSLTGFHPNKWRELHEDQAVMMLEQAAQNRWSRERSPDEWEAVFGYSWKVLKPRIEDGELCTIRRNARAYKFDLRDLPPDYDDQKFRYKKKLKLP